MMEKAEENIVMENIQLSGQARKLISILEKENPNIATDIKRWYINKKMVIGGANVLEYVDKVMK